MVLRPLIRTLTFGVTDIFYSVPCVICCIFLDVWENIYYFNITTHLKGTNFRAYEIPFTKKSLLLHVIFRALKSNLYFVSMDICAESNLL